MGLYYVQAVSRFNDKPTLSPTSTKANSLTAAYQTLIYGAEMMADKKIDAVRGNAQPVEFLLPDLGSGLHSTVIEVSDTNLERDNRFYLTLETRGKTSVQSVESPDAKGQRSASYFLAKALNVDALPPQINGPPRTFGVSGRLLIGMIFLRNERIQKRCRISSGRRRAGCCSWKRNTVC
jgi:hypothetical protein